MFSKLCVSLSPCGMMNGRARWFHYIAQSRKDTEM
jgi:hypothetical protein